MTSKSPVGDISVVTLIRTDTTLDHSQKAEKVWSGGALVAALASVADARGHAFAEREHYRSPREIWIAVALRTAG